MTPSLLRDILFLLKKPYTCSNDITLLENNNLISNEGEIADIFNDYYINIVEYTSGTIPINVAENLRPGTICDDIIDNILVNG